MMANVIRLLLIGHSYSVAMNRAIAREIARDPGFDVTIAAPTVFKDELRVVHSEPEPSGSRIRLCTIDAFMTRYVHVFSYSSTQLSDLLSQQFDVVHAWEEPYILAGYQIARGLRRQPSRFCFRTAQSIVKRYPPPFSFFERETRARAQAWIAGATLVHEAMLRRGYPADRGQILSLAVDVTAFRPLALEERREVANELGLEGPIIGFLGRLTAAKGLDVLMQALERINPSRPWNLLLLGSGKYERRILRWSNAHGWRHRVRILLVKHREVPRYLGAMDMLVAPSQTTRNWREQFGRMIIESFASGVPVIGSDSGEIPHVIRDAGIVVGERDVKGWSEAIARLLSDPAKRAELAHRGHVRVAEYTAEAIAGKYKAFYRWLDSLNIDRNN